MRVRALVLFALSCAPALSAWPAAAAEHRWETYGNARYGYEVCYPADLLTPQREADNGDGRVFTAADGATLRVWGDYNAAEESLATITGKLPPSGAVVTDRHVEATRSVVSGKDGGNIFYAEALLGKDGTVRSLILTYPATEAATFEAIADQLSHCFEPVEP